MDGLRGIEMIKLRVRSRQKVSRGSQSRTAQQPRQALAGYSPAAARSNPHYDRWPNLPSHLTGALR